MWLQRTAYLSHLRTAETMPFHTHAYTTAHQSTVSASSTCPRTFYKSRIISRISEQRYHFISEGCFQFHQATFIPVLSEGDMLYTIETKISVGPYCSSKNLYLQREITHVLTIFHSVLQACMDLWTSFSDS